MKKQPKILAGLYLVIDPSKAEKGLLDALQKALEAKPCAVQIWDNFLENASVSALICKIKKLCDTAGVPLLINNHPEWVELFDLDGVHFDQFDELSQRCVTIFHELGKLVGITTNNDLEVIRNAVEAGVDYLSFCSIFPSDTSTSCELVDFDSVRQTRVMTDIPIFLAGGINSENMDQLRTLDFDGVAIVSGVMSSPDPAEAVLKYQQSLIKLKK
ncbi:thiamine phosphate synthase [Algoriphagus sp. C2-6-M1]|uniref:thiamine phosphate synthase n=1 Tax=Algoriphagus persicinus TaxID=3108754 RepID=UPI002B397794|nr:thiamine phosphate synthase [Algoriphagus sp. C2-6-M1]MEB2778930.1 thiamine phosphate synthase [Algoriphagus sp. C2-6-M1]